MRTLPQSIARRRPWVRLGPCAAAVLLTLGPGLAVPQDSILELPDMGSPSGSVLSPAQDERLGSAFMRKVRQSLHIVDDPEIETYVQTLGERLAASGAAPGQRFRFFVVEDPTINAFAGPAGYIGVHTGLITATESESELAAVIAHEIAHVTQRHLERSFDAARKLDLPVAAAILAAIVLGTQSPELGQAAAVGIQASSLQYQINFTRENEKEADFIGIQTLAKAGYDPRSMPVFFERLQQGSRYYGGSEIPEYLRTHPVTSNRIADSRARAESYGYRQYSDNLAYHLTRAKVQVLASRTPDEAVERFGKALAEGRYRSEPATRYGYALALMSARKLDAAQRESDRLLKGDPDRIAFLILRAQIAQARRQAEKALQTYRDALALYPDNHPLTVSYARTLLAFGKAKDAYDLLKRYARSRPTDPTVRGLLAKAAGEAGFAAEGHQEQAELYYLTGNTEAAIRQLEIARRAGSLDRYQRSEIEARLAELRDEFKAEKKRGDEFR